MEKSELSIYLSINTLKYPSAVFTDIWARKRVWYLQAGINMSALELGRQRSCAAVLGSLLAAVLIVTVHSK